MKRKIFEGVVNGTTYNSQQEYLKAYTKAVSEGKEFTAHSSLQVVETSESEEKCDDCEVCNCSGANCSGANCSKVESKESQYISLEDAYQRGLRLPDFNLDKVTGDADRDQELLSQYQAELKVIFRNALRYALQFNKEDRMLFLNDLQELKDHINSVRSANHYTATSIDNSIKELMNQLNELRDKYCILKNADNFIDESENCTNQLIKGVQERKLAADDELNHSGYGRLLQAIFRDPE